VNSKTQLNETLTQTTLSGLLAMQGIEKPVQVDFTGGDICLESPFYCGEAASSVLAAQTLLAAQLCKLGGKDTINEVAINTRLAEASLVSFALQSFTDQDKAPSTRLPPEERTPAAGFFTCQDGRVIYIHSSFPDYPQHSDAILQLLGVPADRTAVSNAVAKLPARELEERIAHAGLCGAMVRTTTEWDESTAGQLLAAVPVVELIKITDGNSHQFLSSADRPLANLKVLDLTRVLAGPVCARSLSGFGADVLHIRGKGLPNVEAFVTDTGIGKKSAYLNLKSENDRDALRGLVKQSHVFSQGYRSGVMERLGFGVEQVAELNPDIIYVSINCYGHQGQWCQQPGWEQLAQVVTGMATHQGNYHQDGAGLTKPALQPSALNDYTTGYLAALGVMMAKRRQVLEGGGYWVRVSLCRTAMWVQQLGCRDFPVQARMPQPAELQSWYQRFDTAWGELAALSPAIRMNGSALQWPAPPVPLGTHGASFST